MAAGPTLRRKARRAVLISACMALVAISLGGAARPADAAAATAEGQDAQYFYIDRMEISKRDTYFYLSGLNNGCGIIWFHMGEKPYFKNFLSTLFANHRRFDFTIDGAVHSGGKCKVATVTAYPY